VGLNAHKPGHHAKNRDTLTRLAVEYVRERMIELSITPPRDALTLLIQYDRLKQVE